MIVQGSLATDEEARVEWEFSEHSLSRRLDRRWRGECCHLWGRGDDGWFCE
jgi:hypothetical protein